jgi:flagellar motor switch protein FliN/FliY
MDNQKSPTDATVGNQKNSELSLSEENVATPIDGSADEQSSMNKYSPQVNDIGDKNNYELSDFKKGDWQNTGNMDLILDIPIELSVELGRTKILVSELLKLGQSSVLELSKISGESLDILANQRLIARGEVVVVNEKYGIRITEIVSPMERVEKLR